MYEFDLADSEHLVDGTVLLMRCIAEVDDNVVIVASSAAIIGTLATLVSSVGLGHHRLSPL